MLPSVSWRQSKKGRDTGTAKGQELLMSRTMTVRAWARSSLEGMIGNMEMRHLQTFALAAETQGFTRAAELLGLSQAAVSQHVAALERELCTALFERGPRSVALTETGRRVYAHVKQILELVDVIQQEAGHRKTVVSGTITIACSTVPAEWLLPELLVKFRKLFPEVQESVSVSDSETAIHTVESGAAEVGLVGDLPRAANLCAKSIAQDELTLVVAPNHEFAEKGVVSPNDLVGQSLIVRESGSASRRCVEQALSKAGLAAADLRCSMEVNSNDAIRAAVQAELGVSFLSKRAVAHEIQDGRLIAVEIEDFRAVRNLYLIHDPQRLPARVVRVFLRFLESWRSDTKGPATR